MTEFRTEDNKLIIALKGRIDSEIAPKDGERISELRSEYPGLELVFDAGELSYICSAGLRELLKLYKKEKHLKIVHVSKEVYEIFDITGLTDIFDLETEIANNTETESGINATTWDSDFIPAVRMFENEVKRNPGRFAVVSTKRCLTYKELNDESNRIANLLQYMGIRADDIVMVLLNRSVEVYAACLGILKAGAAFLVADTEYPDERIQFMYEDSSCRYLITTHEICFDKLDLIIELKKRPLFYENITTFPDTENTKQRIEENDLAYCIYTSGSTGKPKGVLIEQENLFNFLDHNPKNRETMGVVDNSSNVLAVAPMTFDFSIMEAYIPLTSGHTVVMASNEEIRNPLLLKDLMKRFDVDCVMGTPGFLNTIISIPQMKEVLKNVKVYDFGAEAFQGDLYSKITAINPDAVIMNGYGPTETTISCTMKMIDSPENITIGTPNANVYVYVVDENNNEVPDGEMGELLISGKGVGRGYINLPDKTDESFIMYNGERAYKSGDLARITKDGEIEYHGRKDSQIKFHGLRIELGEIERITANCPGVNSTAATLVKDRYLCLYFTGDSEITENAVKDYAKQHLAHYMLPSVYIKLDEMPLSMNMKIDKKALPVPVIPKDIAVPAENDIQQKLLDILKDLIPEEDPGIDADLFATGLSSLKAIIMLAMIQDEFGIVIKSSDLQNAPTVRELETVVRNAPALVAKAAMDKYHCMLVQTSLYYDMLQDNSSINTIACILKLDLSTDQDRLLSAIKNVITKHIGLSAEFKVIDNVLYQIPRPEVLEQFEPVVISLSEEEFGRKDFKEEYIEASDPFLFRIRLYITEAGKYLYMAFAHTICDGDSVDIIVRDVADAYNGAAVNEERMSLFDLGEEHHNYMESMLYAQTVGYYRKMMSGLDSFTKIPPDMKEDVLKAGYVERKIKLSYQDLKKKCSSMNVSENAYITAVFSIALSRLSQKQDAAFAAGFNGRNDSRLSNTVGCISTVVLTRNSIIKDRDMGTFASDIQKQLFESMSQMMVPFEEMSSSYDGFLDIVLVCQISDEEKIVFGKKEAGLSFLSESSFTRTHKMVVQAFNYGDDIVFTIDYHANLYKKETMEKLLLEIENATTRETV